MMTLTLGSRIRHAAHWLWLEQGGDEANLKKPRPDIRPRLKGKNGMCPHF